MYNQPSNLEGWSIVGWVTFWGPFDPRVVVLTDMDPKYHYEEDQKHKVRDYYYVEREVFSV